MAEKHFVFKEETRRECLARPIYELKNYYNIYPGNLKALDPEHISFGIWISGSTEIIEYINASFSPEKKKKRIDQLLKVFPAYQKVSKLLVLKEDKQRLYQNISNHNRSKMSELGLSEAEKDISESYLKVKESSAKLLSFVDKEAVAEAEQVTMQLVDRVSTDDAGSDFLMRILNNENNIFDQISLTTLMATSIGKELGLKKHQLKIISLGCLFMDIGLTRLSIPGLYTDILTAKNQLLYERHPIIGVEELNTMEARGVNLPPEIFIIAEQHHETYNGRGFPNSLKGRLSKKNKKGIHPYALIVGLADKFSSYFVQLEKKPRFKPLRAVKALNRLTHNFDPAVLAVFNNIVGYLSQQNLQVDENVTWITED